MPGQHGKLQLKTATRKIVDPHEQPTKNDFVLSSGSGTILYLTPKDFLPTDFVLRPYSRTAQKIHSFYFFSLAPSSYQGFGVFHKPHGTPHISYLSLVTENHCISQL